MYPLLQKRILTTIRVAFENYILRKANTPDLAKYQAWLDQYFKLSEDDKLNVIKKVERAQTSGIIYAMAKQDDEIFVNQLGCFYIKPTTIAFYDALNRLTAGKEKGEYDYEEVKASALEESRAMFFKIHNLRKYGKTGSIKI